jgi:hypothetical protein
MTTAVATLSYNSIAGSRKLIKWMVIAIFSIAMASTSIGLWIRSAFFYDEVFISPPGMHAQFNLDRQFFVAKMVFPDYYPNLYGYSNRQIAPEDRDMPTYFIDMGVWRTGAGRGVGIAIPFYLIVSGFVIIAAYAVVRIRRTRNQIHSMVPNDSDHASSFPN